MSTAAGCGTASTTAGSDMHAIRLTNHWTITEIEPGRVRYTRRFGSPRLQDANETIWLVGISPGNGTMTVNGELAATLNAGEQFEVNVTAILKPRNEAWIEV